MIGLWREGERRLNGLDPAARTAAERVVAACVDELRRRLGGTFTADELAELYLRAGSDWCFDVAVRVAPGAPEAWDITTVGGAAYLRYLRSATDYAGGRRVAED